MKRRLLILGASSLQLPAIKVAKHKGFLVGVVDRDPYAVGMDYADVCYQVSTTDIDGVLNVAAEFQPDEFTLATDMCSNCCCVCASEL